MPSLSEKSSSNSMLKITIYLGQVIRYGEIEMAWNRFYLRTCVKKCSWWQLSGGHRRRQSVRWSVNIKSVKSTSSLFYSFLKIYILFIIFFPITILSPHIPFPLSNHYPVAHVHEAACASTHHTSLSPPPSFLIVNVFFPPGFSLQIRFPDVLTSRTWERGEAE